MIRVFYRPCGNTYKEQHTAAYELLGAAVSLLGLPLGRIEKTELGKPYFADCPNTFFSISHTNGLAVVAIGDSECGIDAEKNREVSERIRNKYLSGSSENDAIIKWTERESYGKLEGSGFFAKNKDIKVKYVSYVIYGDFTVTVCAEEDKIIDEKATEFL